MNRRARILTLFVVSLLIMVVSCKREGSNRDTATTGSDVAPTTAGATDTSYVGGGGNNTSSTLPTSTDTAGTAIGGAPATKAGTADVSGKAATKSKTEPGRGGKAPGKKP
jgi:hypothetical protein